MTEHTVVALPPIHAKHGSDVEQLDHYDFGQAFQYGNAPNIVPPGATNVSGNGLTLESVEFIEELWGESTEGYSQIDVLVFGKLFDGRWFSLSAGCDTTGWDCQAWGDASVASTRDDIVLFGLSDADRFDKFEWPRSDGPANDGTHAIDGDGWPE